MRTSRWAVAVAVAVLMSQVVIASPGRRRSVGVGSKVEIEGVIKSLGTGSLVITTSHKDDVTVVLNEATVIRHGQTPVAAADLAVGDRVHVKATQNNDVKTATEIEVQNENENEDEHEAAANGIVASVGTASLVVTTASGDVTVNVDAATVIRSKANAITLADIKVGDRVEAEGTRVDDHTILAKHIQLEREDEAEHGQEASVRGAVTAVGTASLAVGAMTVEVGASTDIRRHGERLTLSDIKVGDRVEAEGTLVDEHTLQARRVSVERSK